MSALGLVDQRPRPGIARNPGDVLGYQRAQALVGGGHALLLAAMQLGRHQHRSCDRVGCVVLGPLVQVAAQRQPGEACEAPDQERGGGKADAGEEQAAAHRLPPISAAGAG